MKRGRKADGSMFDVSPELRRSFMTLYRQGRTWVYIARCLKIDSATVRRYARQIGLCRPQRTQETPSGGVTDAFSLTSSVQEKLVWFIWPESAPAVPTEDDFTPTPQLQEQFRAQLRREIDEALLESHTTPLYRGCWTG